MRAVIADTGPLNYLILIDQINLLPHLFEAVLIPEAVRAELAAGKAPQIVRDWIEAPPAWLLIKPTPAPIDLSPILDAGEQTAIGLALDLKIDLLIMDERAGVKAARAKGLRVVGTLGVLDQAAAVGLIDLPQALARLTATNFRVGWQLIEMFLAKYPAET